MAEPLPICYLNGEFQKLRDARVSPLDRAFLFGDSVYEVLPVFGGRMFRFREHFDRLARSVSVELAILPIGAYDPWIANHASPEQAWRMFRGLGARYLLPVHHSTFRLSREPLEEPLERLRAAAGADAWRIVAPEVGSTWSLPTNDP